jgi:hypothetical protein
MSISSPVSVKERAGEMSSNFSFFFRSLKEGKYRIRMDAGLFGATRDTIAFIESGEFDILLQPDSKRPLIDYISHTDNSYFPADSIIRIRFSEPVDQRTIHSGTVRVFDSDSIEYILDPMREDDFGISRILHSTDWNRTYTIAVDEKSIVDLSGNRLGDSVRFYNFRTYNEDSLGWISGSVSIDTGLDAHETPLLMVSTVKGEEILRKEILANSFNFHLPPGKYFLSGFLDRNNNRAHDHGSLLPFRFAETFAAFPDTLRVRARFETAGVEFKFR